jgi:transposase
MGDLRRKLRQFVFEGQRHISIASLEHMRSRTVVVQSFSKVSFPSNFVFQGSLDRIDEMEVGMFKIPRQEYTAEFKQWAVKRLGSGQRVAALARELGLVGQTLRAWVSTAKAGKVDPAGTKAINPEPMELSRVRAENARLRMEIEIQKKAALAKGAL